MELAGADSAPRSVMPGRPIAATRNAAKRRDWPPPRSGCIFLRKVSRSAWRVLGIAICAAPENGHLLEIGLTARGLGRRHQPCAP